jgi:hypothetical protein
MSPLVVLAFVSVLTVLAVLVFVAVVIGIHSESGYRTMTTRTHRPLGIVVRRLLGVYVSKPSSTKADHDPEECLTGTSTDWWDKSGWDR